MEKFESTNRKRLTTVTRKGESGLIPEAIIRKGMDYLETPYQFNAPPHQSETFDCSSFVQYLYGLHGIKLPRNSRQQYLRGRQITYHHLRKGDLLFFTTTARKNRYGLSKIGHVSIYMGNDLMLHTTRHTGGVAVERINRYWKSVFLGAKRVINESSISW